MILPHSWVVPAGVCSKMRPEPRLEEHPHAVRAARRVAGRPPLLEQLDDQPPVRVAERVEGISDRARNRMIADERLFEFAAGIFTPFVPARSDGPS